MFGLYRYILAHLVVLSHLWPSLTNWSGIYAVFGFYTLSGYLIVLILNEKYAGSVEGLKKFFINRFLRIYPTYLTVLILSLAIVLIIPGIASNLSSEMRLPSSVYEWMSNLLIFGLQLGNSVVVSPAWTLNVELCFYIIIAFLLANHPKNAIIAFGISLIYTTLIIIGKYNFYIYGYTSMLAALLPFSVGTLIYHFKNRLKFISAWHAFPVFILFILHNFTVNLLWGGAFIKGFYISFILNVWLLVALSKIDVKIFPNRYFKIDKLLGNMSYPIYLCHFPIAALVVGLHLSGIQPDGKQLFFSSLLLINLAAYALYFLVEMKVQKLRDRIRPSLNFASESRNAPK